VSKTNKSTPFTRLFPSSWRADTSAGITTAVMLVPQGMAYAMLAGLPPIMGLYAATVPLFLYAIVGTSRQLAVGPVALASLLVASGIADISGGAALTEGEYVALAILLTLSAGCFQLLMGIFRLGGLVNLLSHPVVSGFTAAAALIIGVSQLQHVVGFSIPKGLSPVATAFYIISHITEVHIPTLVVGVGAIGLIGGLQKWRPELPAALIAVIIGISTSFLFDFEALGIAVLGFIPSGLPTPAVPQNLSMETFELVAPMGLTIALVAFMESISAAKVYARQNRYDISPSQELIAMGLSNIGAAYCGAYVVGGALSRTAVNAASGAKSKLAGIITALAVTIVITTLTGPFAYLPKPILAAIILVAIVKLIDIQEMRHLWKIKRDDLALLGITFFATLLGSVEIGLLVGVGSSLLWLVISTTRPTVATLGRLPGTRSYRCVDHFKEAEIFEGVTIIRMDAQFFFGNVVYLKDAIYTHVDLHEDLTALVIDASSMNALDSTAADTFEEIIKELRAKRVEVMISHVKGSVLHVMEHAGLLDVLGKGHVYYEVEDAVDAAIRHRDAVRSGVPIEEEEFGESDMID
jgi:sulfate permease, SulP family